VKVRELINALDSLTAGGTQNMDLDVLVRAPIDVDGDDFMIASSLALRLEETCADEDTLFIDAEPDDDQWAQDQLAMTMRKDMDTEPAPPPEPERRHLRLVRADE
jgi:hypothetical protein